MNRLPGPRSPRAVLSLARRLNNDPHSTLLEMRETYGPVIEFGKGKFKYIYLLSPEANEHILVSDPANFTWKEAFQPLVAVNGETALVVSDGDEHKRRRRIVQPAFHTRRIASYLDIMIEEAKATIDSWLPGGDVDGYTEFRLTIRQIVLRCLFGEGLGGRHEELGDHLEVALAYINRPPLLRWDANIPGLPYHSAMRARRNVDDIVFAEIARRRASDDHCDDILTWLIDEQDNGGGLTDQEVRDQVVSLIAAGYDTTASAMGWAVAELAADSRHRDQIRAEYSTTTATQPLTINHLSRLTYTKAFVTEVLRLHPPAIWSGRRVVSSFELHGRTVPAGAMVLFSPHVTQHLPEQFPDPESFRPGRWIEGHRDQHDHHPYAYIPFGGGNRKCLGFAFAIQELTVLTALLTASVEFRLANTNKLKPAGTMSSAPAGGVPILVESFH